MVEPQPLPESSEPIGPYRIVRALSRGGMGEVFLGRDDRLNRWVAIKRIRHDSDNPILRQRLLQEAHAAGGLRHPAIVVVYHLLRHAGDDCIVMEYVEGENLAEALRGGPLDPALALRLAEAVASGLAAAHAAGFIHRDLKAENVMVTPAREAKVLDFGLAKSIGIAEENPALTEVGCVVGTSRAMSPEQAMGVEVDERSDLFSLGVLLYEMLTASSPFQGPNSQATRTKVVFERPPCLDTLRPGLPPRLVALVYRLLSKEPEARPQSAAEVARELHAIGAAFVPVDEPTLEETLVDLPAAPARLRGDGGSRPPLAMPPPEATPPPEEIPRAGRPWRLAIAVAVLLALGLGLGSAALFRLGKQQKPNPVRRDAAGGPPPSRQALPETKAPPSRPPELGPSPEDRAAVREIQLGLETAENPPRDRDEDRLDQILKRSPRWLDARILAIEVAVGLFRVTKSVSHLDYADRLIREADLPQNDLRLVPVQFKVALAAGRAQEAERALSRIAAREPENPQLPELQAQWAEKNEKYDKALVKWKLAVQRHHTWQNLLRLAKVEIKLGAGHVDDARGHLEEIHQKSQANVYATQVLAELELYYGDPGKAQRLYEGLISRSRQTGQSSVSYQTNLGIAFVFLSKYEEAARAFNEALRFEPNDIPTLLALADVETQQHPDDARSYYQKVLRLLKWDNPEGSRKADDQMIEAQCLAHLGETQKAMEIAGNAVKANPDDTTNLQSAALVFTLAGDIQALDYIQRAIKKGIQPRWFNFPSYDRLRDDPTFQQLVKGKG